jgi:mRNA-degrading endonuclease RelE of RelBE toxin-antitoxin system
MYKILIKRRAEKFFDELPAKSRKILEEHIKVLIEFPYAGKGRGDKKKLKLKSKEIYRMHIGRSYTMFYEIHEEEKVVEILNILTIEEAHKLYGRL